MWGSIDELFDEAFNHQVTEHNFMTDSDVKVLYFNLLREYKSLRYDYRKLNKDFKHLSTDYEELNKKYLMATESSDLVPGHVHRKLLSKYKSLDKEYHKLLDANVALSDELTYLKSLDESVDNVDENSY